jgi:hypothetical protein
MEVEDYWLQDDDIYYLNEDGVQGFAPLNTLDFTTTQQLDLDRHQPFVLESRPR